MRRAVAAGARSKQLFDSRASILLSGIWGAAEASVFFVVPDVWLGLVGLLAPRRAPAAFGALLIGAAVGSSILFGISRAAGPAVEAYQASLPGLSAAELAGARDELAERGLGAMLGLPLQGYPLKVGVHAAAQLGFPFADVVLFSLLNRLVRVGPYVLVTAVAGVLVARWIHARPGLALALYTATWSVFYAWYWLLRPI